MRRLFPYRTTQINSIPNAVRIALLTMCVAFAATHSMYASDIDELSIRVGAGINSNQHKAGFASLPIYTNQFAAYNDATSTSYHFDAGLQYYPSVHWGIGGTIRYAQLGATLSSTEFIGNQEVDGQLIPISTTHTLQTNLAVLSIEPQALFRPFLRLPLTLSLGLDYGFFVTKTFSQSESLSQQAIDAGFRFVDQNGQPTTVRQKGSGTLPSVNPYQALNLSAQYALAINTRLSLGFNLGYTRDIREIVQGTGWKVHQLQAGLSVGYRLQSTVIPDPPIEEEPSPESKPEPALAQPTTPDSSALAAAAKQHKEESLPDRDTTKPETAHNSVDSVAQVLNDTSRPEVEKRDSAERHSIAERETVHDTASAQTASSTDTTVLAEGETVNSWTGCVIILSSSESAWKARSLAREAMRVGVDSVTVVPWYDKNDRTRYYRVQLPLHRYEELQQVREKLETVEQRFRRSLSPVIKCN